MRNILRFIDALCVSGAFVAGASIALLVLIGGAEVVLRSFFSISLSFVVEYNGYLLAIAFLGGSAHTFRNDGHIRVTMLLNGIPEKPAKYLDIGCTIAGLFISIYLLIAMFKLAAGSAAYNTLSFFPSRTPLVYPQSAVTVLLGLLSLAIAARLIRLCFPQYSIPSDTTEKENS